MDLTDFSTNVEVINDDNERICKVNCSERQTIIILGIMVIILLVLLVAAGFFETQEIRKIVSLLQCK